MHFARLQDPSGLCDASAPAAVECRPASSTVIGRVEDETRGLAVAIRGVCWLAFLAAVQQRTHTGAVPSRAAAGRVEGAAHCTVVPSSTFISVLPSLCARVVPARPVPLRQTPLVDRKIPKLSSGSQALPTHTAPPSSPPPQRSQDRDIDDNKPWRVSSTQRTRRPPQQRLRPRPPAHRSRPQRSAMAVTHER